LVVLAVALSAGGAALAQTGEYFVTAGDESTTSVLQGNSINRQWGNANGVEYPIAVPNSNEVRTAGRSNSETGTIYDGVGNVIGGPLQYSQGGNFYDATTDGNSIYMVEFSSGQVYRTDLNYQNPQALFSTNQNDIGITYDPSGGGGLWISNWGGTNVTHYDLGGTPVSSFSTGHSLNAALALDPSDGTLWLADRSSFGLFEQWTTSGTNLFRGQIPGMDSQNVLGGEFASRVPAPGAAALLGLGGLVAGRRRR
jgi:hypothetical protein